MTEIPVLTSRDKNTILEAGFRVIGDLLSDYPHQLPDAVILPDTAARPLTYLLRPVLNVVSAKRQVNKPRFFYFKVAGTQQELTDPFTGLYYGDPAEDLLLNRLRAEEIKDYTSLSGEVKPSFIIFDDYISPAANTVKLIRQAFGEQIPAYALLLDTTSESRVQFSRSLIKAGLTSSEKDNPYWNLFSFDYRRDRPAIGVEKGTRALLLHSSIYQGGERVRMFSDPPDPQRVVRLRQEITDLGIKIAQHQP